MSSDNLDKKLSRLHNFIISPSEQKPTAQTSAPRRYLRLARRLGGDLVGRDEGSYCLVRTVYPWGHRFGDMTLELPESATVAFEAFTAQPTDQHSHLGDLLFFDTETTGLGGSGAVAFLIGVGALTEAGFEVRQYILPDYPDEPALLEDFIAEWTDSKTMVSYNGAAFDLPLVKDRLVMSRVARDFEPSGHLDLLHPTRRLFKRRLQDCSLTNIEREIFNFHRTDDIPGYLIPSVYFAWLADESLDLMAPVLEHNRLDILALYFLAVHLDDVFRTEGNSLDEIDDIHSLSKVYGRRKQHEQVLQMYRRLSESTEPLAPDALFYHSLALKRAGQWADAVFLWEQLAGDAGREAYLSCLELAKYYEHRGGDIARASVYCEKAKILLPESPSQREALFKRLKRLRDKQSRS